MWAARRSRGASVAVRTVLQERPPQRLSKGSQVGEPNGLTSGPSTEDNHRMHTQTILGLVLALASTTLMSLASLRQHVATPETRGERGVEGDS
jgi:hypothetical protein